LQEPILDPETLDDATARALIQAHFDASNVVVEWPQSGERLRGRENIIGFRSAYPARQEFELHRVTGSGDLWVNEYTIRYDDRPVMAVGVMEFRDGKVVRERIFFGEQFEPPAWRAGWVELFDPADQ
jgi:SnoaL-like domain